jgi:hypothetical protein
MDKLRRFAHNANYDVVGVGRRLTFSIPVWLLEDKQTLNIKSVKYEPGPLGCLKIEAIISPKVALGLPIDNLPATNEKPETQEPPYSLK